MNSRWRSLLTQFGIKRARSPEAQLTLSRAYRNVFTGKPSTEEQEMVLADLLKCSGFNMVSEGVSTEELWRREGKRSLYAQIFSHLSLAPEDLHALENAARREAAIDQST